MFLVSVKFGPFKFITYLILIVLLVPKFFATLSMLHTFKNIIKSYFAKNCRKI